MGRLFVQMLYNSDARNNGPDSKLTIGPPTSEIACDHKGAAIMNFVEKFHAPVRATEIAFDGLGVDDTIVIQTERSQYQFRIIDPMTKRGILSGGSLCRQHAAELLETTNDGEHCRNDRLRIGLRAVFRMEDLGWNRLISSAITNLVLLKSG